MQQLSIAQIKSITYGATYIKQDNGYVFYRFTDSQYDIYKQTNKPYHKEEFYIGHFAGNCRQTAGINFDFVTNSKKILIKSSDPEKKGEFFDIYINKKLKMHIPVSKDIDINLNGKHNRVSIYFPNIGCPHIQSISLDGEISVVKKEMSILIEGDSITQGIGADYPSLTYSNRLSRMFNAEIYNHGNAAYVYDKNTIDNTFNPDIIIVSYGINDIWRKTKENVIYDTKQYYERLLKLYPSKKIYVILPLWNNSPDITWNKIEEYYRYICSAFNDSPQITSINGWKLIPHNSKYLYDNVHPNEKGYSYIASRIYKIIFKDLNKEN